MKKNTVLVVTLFFLIATAILHFYSGMYDLYFYIWWWDLVAHFLAGATIGSAILSFWRGRALDAYQTIGLAVVSAFLVGVIWELFEYYFGLMPIFPAVEGYVLDTITDVIADILGAATIDAVFMSFVNDKWEKLE